MMILQRGRRRWWFYAKNNAKAGSARSSGDSRASQFGLATTLTALNSFDHDLLSQRIHLTLSTPSHPISESYDTIHTPPS